ncbi:MAG TPA: glycosyltransferase family 39 protein, partial [Gemmatimonadaceae bacterium]|nr:glycosyltransferase family 39 protein [Gemmatimonadaceae bacterium]
MSAESGVTRSVGNAAGFQRGMRIVPALLMILAVAIAAWAVFEPRFRDGSGTPEGAIVFPFAAAAAMTALAVGIVTGAARVGLWLSILLLAQISALLLVDAGNRVGYQHIRSPERILRETSPVVLAVLLAQLALVVVIGRDVLRRVAGWVVREFGWGRLLAITILAAIGSAALARSISGYAVEVVSASLLHLLALALVIIAVASLSNEPRRLRALTHDVVGTGLDRAALLGATWVLVLGVLLNVLSYQRHPHVPDEVGYLWQARYFAQGLLTMPAPPVPEAFRVYLMEFIGARWYSVVPPGWPLALTAGELIGAPWLVNPVLAALSVLLTWSIVGRLYSRRTARLVVLLLATSPWFIFMAMNFMTHTHSLFCALLATWAVLRLREERKLRWAIVGGIGIGLVGLTRPLEGVAVALLLGVWALGSNWRRPRIVDAGALALST